MENNSVEQGEVDLRRELLTTDLKLLGYPTIQSAIQGLEGDYDADKSYRALGKIGHILENYTKSPEERYQETQKISTYMSSRDEILDRSRAFWETFELGMKDKTDSSDWNLYESQIKKIIRFYLGANYDLLSPEDREKAKAVGVKDYSSLPKIEVEDKISDIIDSTQFSKAVDIEDKFTISEAVEFIKAVDDMVGKDEEIRKTAPAVALLALQKVAIDTRDKKLKFKAKYEDINSRYVKSAEEIRRIVGNGNFDQTDEAFHRKGDTNDGR